jgi:hypothetical protein
MSPLEVKVLDKDEVWFHTPGWCTEAQFEAARLLAQAEGFECFTSNPFVPDGARADGPITLVYFMKGTVKIVDVSPSGEVQEAKKGPIRFTLTMGFDGTEAECEAFARRVTSKLSQIVGKDEFELLGWQHVDDDATA